MINEKELDKYGEIKKVISFFQEINMIPRASGNEQEIVKYLSKFALKRNLEYYVDDYRNVIIKKRATNEHDNNYIAFQSHTDMICEKISGSKHDFSKDAINLVIDQDYIKSNETSIGADNGIGVAYMLAILDSNNFKHPNLEMIFTSSSMICTWQYVKEIAKDLDKIYEKE